jgi:hypothetical protein
MKVMTVNGLKITGNDNSLVVLFEELLKCLSVETTYTVKAGWQICKLLPLNIDVTDMEPIEEDENE